MSERIIKSEEEWKKELAPALYHVAREKGTEAPYTGKYWDCHENGIYTCAVCGMQLFAADTKFDSGSGWPSFSEPINLSQVKLREDVSNGRVRIEVVCAICGSHLGHMFNDGPRDRGGKRYCINSLSLDLDTKEVEPLHVPEKVLE